MDEADAVFKRIQFFGARDLATGWSVPRVAELVEQFDASNVSTRVVDIIEWHNVQQYLEHGFFPSDYSEAQCATARSRISEIKSTVARFFSAITESNCESVISNVDHEYHRDMLDLLGRYKAFDRCSAQTMLRAIRETGVHLGLMLSCKKLVIAYDSEIREIMTSSHDGAEHLIRKHLQRDAGDLIHLPRSLTTTDVRGLLESYIDNPDANPNYLGLIESAPVSAETGINAKLKLRAKRRKAEITKKFFESNTGIRTGIEVRLSDTQDEPSTITIDESDGIVTIFTFSMRWLNETIDHASILNNFQHVFEFADRHVLLSLPSYPAQLGVLERLMGTPGRTHYQTGAGFRTIDTSSLLQTNFYLHFLESRGKNLEEVISWFFRDYLQPEFGASGFSFRPSSEGATYLERVRHLFAEMESVMMQFSLFVEDGEIDWDLLAITSDPVLYKRVPSQLAGKYVYSTDAPEITQILHAMFSDQSTLHYISEQLKGRNATELLLQNDVAYSDFHDYQKPAVDHLITLRILEDTGSRVRIANAERVLVLKWLFERGACNYFHLSERGRDEVRAMVEQGWVERRSSLLTEAEGQYFNYFLNKVEFSNGPELRNKYLHGSQVGLDGEDGHFQAYITALRMIIALVIKLNDDFCLSTGQQSPSVDA